MRLARDVKGNKNSFYLYISSKRLNKEYVGLTLNEVYDLVTVHRGNAKTLCTSFVSVFSNKVFQASVLRIESGTTCEKSSDTNL